MIDSLPLYISLGAAALFGLAALFFYFVKPDATFHGLKLKYLFTAVFTLVASLFLFLLKLKLGKDSAKIGELEGKLKLKSVESSLAINQHKMDTNRAKITEIDKKVEILDKSAGTNADKVSQLTAQRIALELEHERAEAEFKRKSAEKSDLESLVSDSSNRLKD